MAPPVYPFIIPHFFFHNLYQLKIYVFKILVAVFDDFLRKSKQDSWCLLFFYPFPSF